jgi:hypothetical protein
VAGTRAHFTELNRNLAAFDHWRGPLSFSVTPQMHDRSRAQLIESVGMLRLVAEQAVRMADGRPVHLGPVTLRPRLNAVATTPFAPADDETLAAGYGPHLLPGSTDPRQHAPAMAAWTLAVLAALAVPGIASVTLFEAWGPRGIRPSKGAPLAPAGQVINWVCAGGRLVEPEIRGVDPVESLVACIAQQSGTERQLLIGNLGPQAANMRIAGLPISRLDSIGDPSVIVDHSNGDESAAMAVLRIPGFSTARLRSPAASARW